MARLPRRGRRVDLRQKLLEPPHPRRERIAVGLDRLAQEPRQIGAVLVGKARGHCGRKSGDWARITYYRRLARVALYRYNAQPLFDYAALYSVCSTRTRC